MLRKFLITLAVAAAAFVVLVLHQPAEFQIERSIAIAVPPAKVFPHINDLHAWHAWSPWAKMDPHGKESFTGPMAGKGAVMHWMGNEKVGEGTITIVDSRPNDLIRLRIDFVRPMKNTAIAAFIFKPQGQKTLLTWSMSGQSGFQGKAMSLFINCDQTVGGEFQKGLAQLKAVSEPTTKTKANTEPKGTSQNKSLKMR